MEKIITQVIALKYLTEHVVELRVRLIAPDTIRFKAGQFMQFLIHGVNRSYPIQPHPE
jgi:NAD(P)H-flavin reductase